MKVYLSRFCGYSLNLALFSYMAGAPYQLTQDVACPVAFRGGGGDLASRRFARRTVSEAGFA